MARRKTLNQRTSTSSSRSKFELRKQYLQKVVPTSEYDNFFDSSLMPHYGKVDKKGNVIYPSEQFLVPLNRNASFSADSMYALDFVAKAFTDLQKYLNKANQLGILVLQDQSVDTISPAKAWQSLHVAYTGHIKALYRSLLSSYFEKPSEKNGLQHARPKDFEHYMKSIKNLYSTKGGKFPLTRSSYILSNKCPRHISGLVIEITPVIDYSDDASKDFTYIESPNFKFYMYALKKFGFMADKDYPGRIIADLGSPKMQEYMSQYLSEESAGDPTVDDMFDLYYHKAKTYDYELIRVYLMQFYNNYATVYPFVSETKVTATQSPAKYFLKQDELILRSQPPLETSRGTTHGCVSTTKIIERSLVSEIDIESKYNENYWIPVYAEFLNYELNNPLTEHELEKTIKNAKDLKKSVDFDAAIGYIGDKFNFYRYPLSDLTLINYEHG